MPAQQNIWLWDSADSAWVKAPASVVTKRMTAAGQVIAGAHKLYWIACTPSAANAAWSLTDDLDGLSGMMFEHFDTDRHSEQIDFFPPLEFKKGLYVLSFLNMSSLAISYES